MTSPCLAFCFACAEVVMGVVLGLRTSVLPLLLLLVWASTPPHIARGLQDPVLLRARDPLSNSPGAQPSLCQLQSTFVAPSTRYALLLATQRCSTCLHPPALPAALPALHCTAAEAIGPGSRKAASMHHSANQPIHLLRLPRPHPARHFHLMCFMPQFSSI